MKRIIPLLLVLTMMLPLLPAVRAYNSPVESSTARDHFYINDSRCAAPIKSTLYAEKVGYVRVEYVEENCYTGTPASMIVEHYDRNLNFRSGMELAEELPVYGGVYIGDDYNFLVTGQNNTEEDDSKEVFRITRYDKNWKKIDHASLFGANTVYPFDAGCVRFDRSGDILYIRTSHEMYTTDDGLNHQANVFIALRVSDMTITDSFTGILNWNYGYISHSFNQFVRVDGDTLLAVDHGDALPRSVVLIKYGKKAGEEQFFGQVTCVNAFDIGDPTGFYNDTGVSVGGFECSSSHYLIAGSSTDQDGSVDQMTGHRNIFVTATPKDDFTDEATTIRWLTNYAESDGVSVSPPHLVKLDTDRFILVWTEDHKVKYCFLNGKGQLVSGIRNGEGDLSDCVPIVDGSRLLWYVTGNSAPAFYEIDITHNESPFTDVDPSQFYYEPVLWAVEMGITTGATATTFNPLGQCQRAQVVTFLWRAAGKPEPRGTTCLFVDVKKTDFYYKAVLWALEQGITKGLDATHFGPHANCNRAQVVTFLWRSVGSPSSKAANPFTDVVKGQFYYNAVLWAVEKSITNGLSATAFGANATCNRAQIVTFLHRTFA